MTEAVAPIAKPGRFGSGRAKFRNDTYRLAELLPRRSLRILLGVFLIVAGCAMAQPEAVAFLTDVEGSRSTLEDFLRKHPAFFLGKDGRFHLRDGWIFVHGGDCLDRFPGEREVVGELLRLDEESPGRVVLIAGNRDVNKLRLPLEVSEGAMKREPPRNAADFHSWCAASNLRDCPSARLRWILARTMGAPDAFELRRKAVSEEDGNDAATVPDDSVVQSYLEDARPGGLIHRLLRRSRLMFRWKGTLFVHAGIPLAALCHIPGKPDRAVNLDEWCAGLNRWYLDRIDGWEKDLAKLPEGGVGGDFPGEALIRYSEKFGAGPTNPFSVLYGRETDSEGKVALPAPGVIEWLQGQGIRRLVVGHTPSGHFPVILRTTDRNFEMLVGDTSYDPWPDKGPLISLEGPEGLVTSIQGSVQIASGPAREIRLSSRIGDPGPLGQPTKNGEIAIAPIGGCWVTFGLDPGFRVRYRMLGEKDL